MEESGGRRRERGGMIKWAVKKKNGGEKCETSSGCFHGELLSPGPGEN